MNVELIAYTQLCCTHDCVKPDPVAIVEMAASVCYDSKPTRGFAIAQACAESGHMSVFEHINFVFHVTGVSRALLAQITRHRHAGFSVRSQRYVSESGFSYYTPSKFENDTNLSASFRDAMDTIQLGYDELIQLGAAKEDARYVLPNACCTSMFVSANARALIEMSRLRLCQRAQKEIRELFRELKAKVFDVSPVVSDLMVPSCEIHQQYPFCPERKSCGRHSTLEEVYRTSGNNAGL